MALELSGLIKDLEGFTVEFANISGDPQTTEAFRANALDVGSVADIPPIHATWTGLDVRIIAAGYRQDAVNHPIQELRLGGGRGHRTFTGTPVQVADAIQEWFDGGAADGFNIMPPVLPSGLETFMDQVVHILLERGLFRTGPNTRAGPCGTTTACRGRPTGTRVPLPEIAGTVYQAV